MEASPLSPATNTLDTMSSSPQQFLKLEDLHTATSPSPSPAFEEHEDGEQHMTPAPVYVTSKPAKKRKSWGQQLPEPKTMLPPRKRAKTDDEKEQRRIERIKRNRAAAHNSRERKRQEAETLAVLLAHANAELDAYRSLHGPLPASVVLPEVHVITDPDAESTPSLVESRGTAEAPSPASPPEANSNFNLGTITIKQEPTPDNSLPNLPPAFDLDSKQALSPLDLTQHSAVSVEPSEQQQPEPSFFTDLDLQRLVGHPLPLPHDAPAPGLLQDHPPGHLEPFAFTDGGFDASFNPPLDFSFDDYIHDTVSVPTDGLGAA